MAVAQFRPVKPVAKEKSGVMELRVAERIVAEMEALSPASARRFAEHAKVREFMRWYFVAKCMTDLWTFHFHFVCSLNGGGGYKHYSHRFHGPEPGGLCHALQYPWTMEQDGLMVPVDTKLVVMHRESRKSQTGISWLVWNWLRNPNCRQLLRAYVAPKAKETGQALLSIMESPQFQALFPWVRPARKSSATVATSWRPESFLLHRQDSAVKVPSWQAIGLDGEPTGGHFDNVVYDDLEVKTTAESPILREKMFSQFINDENLKMAMGRRLVIGTPWAKNALIDQGIRGVGIFEHMQYDRIIRSDVERRYDAPFCGHECRIEDDGWTLVIEDGGIPGGVDAYGATGVQHHQVKLTFYNPTTQETAVEIREVIWNDTRRARLSRRIPPILGRPLQWWVGNHRPHFYEGFTLDEFDLPGIDGGVERKSLPKSERAQGSTSYSFQMRLEPVDPGSQVLSPELLETVEPDELPVAKDDAPHWWYRTLDLASSKKTAASTAILTGFWSIEGLFITHIFFENQAKQADILLELFLGIIRAEARGYAYRGHTFETAHLEGQLMENLDQAERDPHAYFTLLGGRYAEFAQNELKGKHVYVQPRITVSRGATGSKPQRNIAAIQPVLQQGLIHVVRGCPNVDILRDQLASQRHDSRDPLDLCDCLADLCKQPRPRANEIVDLAAARNARRRDMHRQGRVAAASAANWGV